MTELPSGISFAKFAGIPVWQVQTPHAVAAISPFGGQLLAWQPAGEEEVFWLSPTRLCAPKPIRGGVPVCWPYFARQGQPDHVPQHGHARCECWQLTHTRQAPDGSVMLQLELPPDTSTPLRLQQQIHIGKRLRQRLISSYESAALGAGADSGVDKPTEQRPPVTLSQALHSYFRVADVAAARIHGVEDLSYADHYDKAVHRQQGPWQLHDPRDPGRSDRIYQTVGHHFQLIDPGAQRCVHIHCEGSQSLVIWNPGQAGARTMADVPDDGWRDFVCVEVANAGQDVVTLAPGQTHILQQTVTLAGL